MSPLCHRQDCTLFRREFPASWEFLGPRPWPPEFVKREIGLANKEEVSFQPHPADLPLAATPKGWDRLSSPLTNEMSFGGTLADGAASRMSRQQTHEGRSSE